MDHPDAQEGRSQFFDRRRKRPKRRRVYVITPVIAIAIAVLVIALFVLAAGITYGIRVGDDPRQSEQALYFSAMDHALFFNNHEMRLIAMADDLGWDRRTYLDARRMIRKEAARFERIRKIFALWPLEREALQKEIDALEVSLRHGFCVKLRLECAPGIPPDRALPKGRKTDARQKNSGGFAFSYNCFTLSYTGRTAPERIAP